MEQSTARVIGAYRVICRKRNGRIRWEATLRNGVTYEGLNHLFDRGFRGITAATWYAGLIAAGGFSAVSANDQMASHVGWVEYLGVSGTDRPTMSWPLAAGGSITSTGSVSIAITSTGTVRGVFMASSQLFGASTGVLYSTAILDDDYEVESGDTIYLTYTAQMG